MNDFVLLPVQKSMVQLGAGEHDQWPGYMTVLVVNHGIVKSISIPTAVIGPTIRFDVDARRDWFWQEVKWTLAIRLQRSTLSALDLDRIYHLPHTLLKKNRTDCLPEGNQ